MFAYRMEELLDGIASTSRVNHKNKLLLIMATIERQWKCQGCRHTGFGTIYFPISGYVTNFFPCS